MTHGVRYAGHGSFPLSPGCDLVIFLALASPRLSLIPTPSFLACPRRNKIEKMGKIDGYVCVYMEKIEPLFFFLPFFFSLEMM